MKMNFKKIAALTLGFLMAFNLTGCGSSDTEQASEPTGYQEVLNIAVAQEAATYDCHKTSSLIVRKMMSGTVWEKLVTLDSNGEVVPELCTSFEMSEDAKTFTFYLREGVMFHDGQEMVADDVVASLNRWIESYNNAAGLVGDGRFYAIDDYTVEIVCSTPALTLPEMLAGANIQAVITTAEACEDEDANGNLNEYIGTGPYEFTEWAQDQYIILDKFDEYVPYYLEDSTEEVMDGWAGYKHAYTPELKFWYVSEEATRVAGLQTGQYDVIFNLSSDNFDMVDSTPGLTTTLEQGGIVTTVFNKSEESICSDINIRKAINAVADADPLLTAAYGSFYDLGGCYMDDINAAWVTDAGQENYNIADAELAKQYLADAGYNGETIRITCSTTAHFDNIAMVLKSQMESIGMNVEIEVTDWPTFVANTTDPTGYDLYIVSFSSVPLPTLKAFYGPTYAGWTDDAHLTELLNDYNTALTYEDAYAAWEEAQAYSWDYLPVISHGHYKQCFGYSEDVEGLYIGSGCFFWNAYVAE